MSMNMQQESFGIINRRLLKPISMSLFLQDTQLWLVKSSTNLPRTCNIFQEIQGDNTVDNEDIKIHGFYFGNKYKKNGWISSLKQLIHLWTCKC